MVHIIWPIKIVACAWCHNLWPISVVVRTALVTRSISERILLVLSTNISFVAIAYAVVAIWWLLTVGVCCLKIVVYCVLMFVCHYISNSERARHVCVISVALMFILTNSFVRFVITFLISLFDCKITSLKSSVLAVCTIGFVR